MTKKRWTADEVYAMLAKRFPPPAFILLPQVRNGTGFARKTVRTADAIACSTYPSRGLYFTGIEIKVSLGDWRKELADPDKADEIQRFCRYWYIAAPKGIVPIGELPDNWGLIECHANRTVEAKAAKSNEAKPPDMLFVMAVLRAMSVATVTRKEMDDNIQEFQNNNRQMSEEAHKSRMELATMRGLKATVEAFEESSGVKIGNQWNAGDIGDAVRLVQKFGADKSVRIARRLRATAAKIVSDLDDATEWFIEGE